MRLDVWLAMEGKTLADLAAETGSTVPTLGRIAAGKSRPNWSLMDEIYKASGGQVTPNDFLTLKPPPAYDRARSIAARRGSEVHNGP